VDPGEEARLRERVMHRLAVATARTGGTVGWKELQAFDLGDGETRRLVSYMGIWNPQDLSATLTIVSSPDGPYNDKEAEGGFLRYDYRAGSDEGNNTKLRRAFELGMPLILLRKISDGVYVPVFPVFVVGDDRERRQFVIALDESLRFLNDPLHPTEDQRKYAERVVRQRLHQPVFRGQVIQAYERRCAVCSLRHPELLDAAHIVEDSHDEGIAHVTNGLSLCKIHHAAFDRLLLGVTTDYEVRINRELLEEIDGPMLKHGLQEMHGRRLELPRSRSEWPDPHRLAHRWDAFRSAS
jgi:putative restriction endonuclease